MVSAGSHWSTGNLLCHQFSLTLPTSLRFRASESVASLQKMWSLPIHFRIYSIGVPLRWTVHTRDREMRIDETVVTHFQD